MRGSACALPDAMSESSSITLTVRRIGRVELKMCDVDLRWTVNTLKARLLEREIEEGMALAEPCAINIALLGVVLDDEAVLGTLNLEGGTSVTMMVEPPLVVPAGGAGNLAAADDGLTVGAAVEVCGDEKPGKDDAEAAVDSAGAAIAADGAGAGGSAAGNEAPSVGAAVEVGVADAAAAKARTGATLDGGGDAEAVAGDAPSVAAVPTSAAALSAAAVLAPATAADHARNSPQLETVVEAVAGDAPSVAAVPTSAAAVLAPATAAHARSSPQLETFRRPKAKATQRAATTIGAGGDADRRAERRAMLMNSVPKGVFLFTVTF